MDKKCLNSIDSVHGELPPPRFAQREHRATNRDRARIEIAHAAVLDVGSREERDNAIIAEGAEDFCAAGHWMRRAGERTERRVANFVGSEITGRRIFFLFLPLPPPPSPSKVLNALSEASRDTRRREGVRSWKISRPIALRGAGREGGTGFPCLKCCTACALSPWTISSAMARAVERPARKF